jgi:hypothetical protein
MTLKNCIIKETKSVYRKLFEVTKIAFVYLLIIVVIDVLILLGLIFIIQPVFKFVMDSLISYLVAIPLWIDVIIVCLIAFVGFPMTYVILKCTSR